VSYELDLFGRLKRGVEAAKADDEAVRAAYDLTKVTVAAETARRMPTSAMQARNWK
jgi:outer membrane protein, multidrug efflux system